MERVSFAITRFDNRAEIGNATPVLSFGKMPSNEVAWISEILQGNNIAFIAADADAIRPMNELARQFPIVA